MNMHDREKEMTMQQHQTAYISRVRFARKGSLTYIGHLDMMRTFERSIRRSGLPLLHSQGYNPRPMLVFALPLGVGIQTVDDYVDIYLSEPIEPEAVLTMLQPYLPPDLSVLAADSLPESVGSIMAIVTTARYIFRAPGIRDAVDRLMQQSEIIVEKMSKGQKRNVDIRSLILNTENTEEMDPDTAEITVCAGSSQNLRPDLFLQALETYTGYKQEFARNAEIVRTGLFYGTYPDIHRILGESKHA
jgi:radical SAM-linked protein